MFDIRKLIPLGKENAIHQEELAKILGVSCGKAKLMVKDARNNGAEIISSVRGYYFPKDDEERKEYVKTQKKQALARLSTIKPISDSLKEFKGQISLSDVILEMSEEAKE